MMKNKLKKVLSVVLVGTMMFSMTACSDKQEEKVTSDNVASEKNAEQKENNAGSEKQELSLVDCAKVDSFNYYNIAAGVSDEEFNNSDLAKMVEEYTGYKVSYSQTPADVTDAQTAITNVFLLKQDYQAVKVTKDQFYTLLAMGALAPMTDYVNASENLKEVISSFGWDTATQDGEIYGIPQKNPMPSSSVGICYRADWLEEYNVANPTATIEEPSAENGYSMSLSDFKTMLVYFKEKVMSGGYAFAIDTNNVFLENILPAFGIYQDWADIDGKLTYVIEQPGFEAYVEYMEDLYDEGLILYQATSNDAGAVKSLQTGNAGAGRIAHWNAYTIETNNVAEGTELSTHTDENIGYIQALVPDECKGDASKVRVYATEGYPYYTVIPNYATEEQIASVVDYADQKLDKEFFLKMILGTEGVTYTVQDGEYYPVLPAFNDSQVLSDKFMDGTREEDYAKYWLCRTRKTAAQDKMFSMINYNIGATGIMSPITVMPPNEEYDMYFSAANTEVKNALVTSMYEKNVVVDLTIIQQKWNEYEGAVINESVNKWYETWENKDIFNAVKAR